MSKELIDIKAYIATATRTKKRSDMMANAILKVIQEKPINTVNHKAFHLAMEKIKERSNMMANAFIKIAEKEEK
ncbi:hypothetical protein A2331_02300 [Candidatus Falkowbacteria bacterium RIFOXYB2_FULL_34_18]|uniref:Uncharacterized protein n=1 Tax=Candidatus Falkowbacteria bacterium RIFOXYD2_FULL_34_120 TaxID=1798007 RepID=A0A1F5TSF5_9BACT|nr:MAG: hypothetical protein A2331_02300 [Candidatus Falkowbacteria bacterium RIFOXYB2_FULL_34_18]OGF29705.1 MAG: hypothetical protein A2500_00325 [Candidatus Falkowbacteria bacterium RIFOXYC12_FULL_34_55]OGF37430.1 MAG: hypothetical protein A2466_00395 [Candidatus Falkowbacteria bacterium RIFOXYC2_FULL_34_220]OGF39155.1 MAG: hypothetical protein A2515_00350 [Candidatus Falkowbacteria bacterium RIFOXYD12_FULL_34_57]OGF41704.1 MAG: hypothetical protein A2531_06070 [Candidatus Falkowbacteria bact